MIDIERRWIKDAACGGSESLLFFPAMSVRGGREVPKKAEFDIAKRICAKCPVMLECRRDMLGEIYGVWGGLDPGERRSARTQRAKAALATPESRRAAALGIAKWRRGNSNWPDVARLVGMSQVVCKALWDWYVADQAPTSTVYLPGDDPEEQHGKSA